jgi:hypothetical protein
LAQVVAPRSQAAGLTWGMVFALFALDEAGHRVVVA